MTDDESQIRTLIESWARAVHQGDIDRETWPPFFTWQAQGASFEIVSLNVTAGEDVAFAYTLLRCGTQEGLSSDPENRLRITIGLRKESWRWLVAHEHHSFPHK